MARAYIPVDSAVPAYHSGDEADESAYLGVYRREVFAHLGGFDEGIKRGQDWELNLRIRTAGGRIWFNPDMEVTYWPRDSWSKIGQRFLATGIWRAELIRRYGSADSLRYSGVGFWPSCIKGPSIEVHNVLPSWEKVLPSIA